jgi:hypothetical protein
MKYLVLVVLTSLVTHGSAKADCGGSVEVLWTYPSDGEVGVPPNSLIWIRDIWAYEASILVTVNGVEVGPSPQFQWAYGPELAPNTDYNVHYRATGSGGVLAEKTFTFRTGSENEPVPETPVITGYTAFGFESYPDTECRQEIIVTGCYDDGENTFYVFDVSGDSFLWRTHGYNSAPFSRSDCGPPVYFSYFILEDLDPCVVVDAISRSGAIRSSEEFCIGVGRSDAGPTQLDAGASLDSGPPLDVDGGSDDSEDSGCSCDTLSGPAPVIIQGLLPALLIATWRRPRPRRQGQLSI